MPFSKKVTGYGQSANDVASVHPETQLLTSYFEVVHSETVKYLKQLTESDFQKTVDRRWDPPVTVAVRLISIVSDDLQHAGQATYIRGLFNKGR